jgi:hypothetical protein
MQQKAKDESRDLTTEELDGLDTLLSRVEDLSARAKTAQRYDDLQAREGS